MSGRKSGLGRGLGDLLADNAPELRGGATVVRRDESGEVTVTPHANDAKNSGSESEYAKKPASERTSIGHGTAIGRNNDCIEIRSAAKTEVRSEERTGEEKAENASALSDAPAIIISPSTPPKEEFTPFYARNVENNEISAQNKSEDAPVVHHNRSLKALFKSYK